MTGREERLVEDGWMMDGGTRHNAGRSVAVVDRCVLVELEACFAFAG